MQITELVMMLLSIFGMILICILPDYKIKIKSPVHTLRIDESILYIVVSISGFILLKHMFILILLAWIFCKNNRNIYNFNFQRKTLFSTAKHAILDFQALLMVWPMLTILSVISAYFFADYPNQAIVESLKNGDTTTKTSIVITALIIAPLCEELLFRKIIYAKLKPHIGILGAVVVCSIIFSIIHLNPKSAATLFALSLFLCLRYEHTNSLLSSIKCHSFFNFIMIAIIISG